MSKKKLYTMLAGLLAVILIGGTFAYWNQTMTIDNPFDTGKYGSTVIEDFNPSEGNDWQPGVEINKDVFVQNTGDQDMIVRAKLTETWTRKGETTPYKTNIGPTAVYQVNQVSLDDGMTAADSTVVTKTFSSSTNWVNGGDGWYYYKTNLAGNTNTDKWLDSVELIDDADMGKKDIKWYVTADVTVSASTVWVEYNGKIPANMPEFLNAAGTAVALPGDTTAIPVRHNKVEETYAKDGSGNTLYGYSNSDYVLTVTVQTVQATREAVNFMFMGNSATLFPIPSACTWTLK